MDDLFQITRRTRTVNSYVKQAAFGVRRIRAFCQHQEVAEGCRSPGRWREEGGLFRITPATWSTWRRPQRVMPKVFSNSCENWPRAAVILGGCSMSEFIIFGANAGLNCTISAAAIINPRLLFRS